MPIVKSRFLLPFLLFFGFLLLYLHNLSNSVYGGDVGDLVTAAYVGGVPHAPGYPLFTFLGFFLSHAIVLYSPVWRVGLISAFSGALGLVFFYLLLKRLTQKSFAAFLTTCILGISFFYWFYAEIAEVFSLHIFFTILLLYVAVLYRQTQKFIYALLLFFTFGLSCTNHQTTILLAPSLFLIIFPSLRTLFQYHKKKLFFLFFMTVIGFFPYIYVPIASSTHPPLNWDNVHDISSFFHLLFRMDYGTFRSGTFASSTFFQRLVSLQEYGQYILSQLTIPVCLLSLIGFWRLSKEKKQRVYFFAFSFAYILTGPVFVYYAGFPITSTFTLGVYERFFIMSGVVFLIPFSFGLLFVTKKLGSLLPKRPYALLFQIVFLIIPLALFLYNFPKTDLSHTQLGDNYAKDILNPLPQNAFLIVSGDTLVFNTWYVHYALHIRPDISIYNLGGGTSDLVSNKSTKEKSSSDILIEAFKKVNTYRPVYSTYTFQPKKGKKLTWVPYGFSYRLLPDTTTIPSIDTYIAEQKNLWNVMNTPTSSEMHKKVNHSLTIAQIPVAYSDAMVTLGSFLYVQYQDKTDALRYYNKAIAVAPDNAGAYLARGVYYFGEKKNCKEVTRDLSTALTFDPFQKVTYFLLYNAYKGCAVSPSLANTVKQSFTAVFQENFEKEAKTTLSSFTLFK